MTDAPQGNMNDADKLKSLFDYTKYHLGVYTTIASILVAMLGSRELASRLVFPSRALTWISLGLLILAGMSGGIVASTLPYLTTFDDFRQTEAAPWFWPWRSLTVEYWTRVEHGAFWLASAALIIAFLVGTPPANTGSSTPADRKSAVDTTVDLTRPARAAARDREQLNGADHKSPGRRSPGRFVFGAKQAAACGSPKLCGTRFYAAPAI